MATMLSVTARRLISRTVGRPTFTANLVHKNAPKAYAIDFQYQRWMSSNPPHEVVGMPSLSPTMESGSIARWNVKEGDEFAAGDSLCEVETDKATVDFEAQDEGFVARIIAEAGPGDIKCGEPILIVVEDASDVDAFKDYNVEPTSNVAHTAVPSSEEKKAAPEPVSTTPAAPTPTPVTPPPASGSASSGGRVVASPLAHMLAKELGFDISVIPGSGPSGRIIASDVKEFTPAPVAAEVLAPATAASVPVAAAPVAEPVRGVGFTDYPLSASAKEVAARLAASKSNVPHYYLTVDLQLDSLLSLRSRLNDAVKAGNAEADGITLNDLLVKAAACAMKAVPSANASWLESAVRVYDNVDINVAVGTGDALYTPVLSNVGGKGVKSISDAIASFVAAADSEEGVAAESCGMGTFTIINLGMYGIKSCAPIITEPQACALALGAAENRIVPNDNADSEDIYKEAVMLTATLSCDHRVIDGAVGAQWLSAFKNYVENPESLLL